MNLLKIQHLYTAYDRIDVLEDVSIEVRQGEITCILGANGAGKSTLIRSILGLTPANRGEILFKDEDICRLPSHQIIERGIACVPEGRKVFPRMTVDENLSAGAYLVKDKRIIEERRAHVKALFPRMAERSTQLAGTLSGGEQAMLAISRSLMSSPDLLIFDEPSLGLSPLFVKENFKIIKEINQMGTTVLLVEQNVRQTLAIAHRGYVISKGSVVAQGNAEELIANAEVQAAYFG
ncbi:ABC transporter ATP-binding protein [Polynucleobacter brandtiae]|uniref:Amino acid/amide ABC transporter ATP-binding protein 2 (HAAT family) n=1 Tax=Polynucleobacter brandtiae TaxID=1938816 RepID=A0A2M8VXW6_9BURK|nr:ABC transporter ATP-binding protein [Polynucleobacter brandtiae]PJI82708.1 amino acid/amide ABC transporter ATP-binding protein 2 (HAAT family) [Polynucleobacter brandtiae]